MSLEMQIRDAVAALTEEDRTRVLNFIANLRRNTEAPPQITQGMYAHLGISISKEEIDEARREAWANFPREIPNGYEP